MSGLPLIPTQLRDTDLAVRTRGLAKRYGSDLALDGIDFQVPEGAVYLLVGPNGAGKSTTVKVLLDLVRADAGTAEVFGLDSRASGPRLRANVGYVPEHLDWGYGWMRVGQLIAYHAAHFASWDHEYADKLVRFFDIRVNRRVRALSKGQGRRLHLMLALAHRPRLLLLDEPIDGLDPFMRDETLGMLAEHLSESPTTMVLSTHHIEEVERFADHVGVMANGRLRAQLSADDLRANVRRYRAEVPAGWQGVPSLNGSVLRRATSNNEVVWTIWGPEDQIARQLANAGAVVREAAAVSLAEASLALLSPKE
jgi:ABC-2 type transport system ATP-binding protein